MVPEMEKKLERPVVAPAKKQNSNVLAPVKNEKVHGVPPGKKENMSLVAMGSELVKGASVDECSKSHANDACADRVHPGEGQDGDATEEPSGSSSSFGDTFSGNDGASALSEDEIDSQSGGGGQPSWLHPGYEEAFRLRKKKVTSHWRDFIRPLMVKCKWAELKMKQFQTQASMYNKLLAQYDQRRQSHLETVEMSGSRSLRPHQIKGDKILLRKKRKRVEDTTDATPYMLQHKLFSHYENNGSSSEYACLNNGCTPVVPAVKMNNDGGNFVDYDDLLEFGAEENSLEHIFSKIEAMQARVHNMTTRVDKVICENPGQFSLLNKLSLLDPSDSGARTAQDPSTLSGEHDKSLQESLSVTPQLAAEPCIEELPASVVTKELIVDSPLNIVEIADQPFVGNASDSAQEEKPLKKRPLADDLIVYKRGTISAKKRRMLPEKQTGSNSNISVTKPQIGVFQTQNEKSSLFMASRYSSLLNTQKRRGKRKGAATGKRLANGPNLTIRP